MKEDPKSSNYDVMNKQRNSCKLEGMYTHWESEPHLSPDAGGLKDSSVPQLNQDLVWLEKVRALQLIGSNTPAVVGEERAVK